MRPDQKAIRFATFAAVTLAIVKTAVGLMTGSLSVLASAVDSLLDFFVSLVNGFALRKAKAPADDRFRYGYGKIEALGALFEGLLIGISGAAIGFFAIGRLISGKGPETLGPSLYVMLFSIAVTGVLVWHLGKVAKQTKSLIVASDALHYKTDLFSNGAVLVGVAAMQLTGALSIDAYVSLGVAAYILSSAFAILKESVFMLMDHRLDEEEEAAIREVIEAEIESGKIEGYHYLKTRKSGSMRHVEFHLVFDPGISLFEAHETGDRVEYEILRRLGEAEILVHLDPYDDSAINEKRAVPMRKPGSRR